MLLRHAFAAVSQAVGSGSTRVLHPSGVQDVAKSHNSGVPSSLRIYGVFNQVNEKVAKVSEGLREVLPSISSGGWID